MKNKNQQKIIKQLGMNFFKVLKINIIIRVEVYSVADLRKIYKEIRSERNISSSTRNIDIRQGMFYEKIMFRKGAVAR